MYRDPFDLARQIADSANPRTTRYLHGSVILDRRGRIIGTGKNHFVGKKILSEDGVYIDKTVHSEAHALQRVDIRRLDDAVIINYGRTNVSAILARPCPTCWAILKKLGFKKVFYTIRSDLKKPVWVEERF
jgi:tRNA(Arg) A34 adenosine deaminase TadA